MAEISGEVAEISPAPGEISEETAELCPQPAQFPHQYLLPCAFLVKKPGTNLSIPGIA
nr:hypothetical protein [Alkalicoccus halolimnae]